MTHSWAVCRCFFDRNIFLPELGHIAYQTRSKFESDYAGQLAGMNSEDKEALVMRIDQEIARRRAICPTKQVNAAHIRAEYRPLFRELFEEKCCFTLGEVGSKDAKQEIRGVYSFPLLTSDESEMLLKEFLHFNQSNLPSQRPTSMRKNGVLLEELGLNHQIAYIVNAVEPLAKVLFPTAIGASGLDSFKAFTVEYRADGNTTTSHKQGQETTNDTEQATHFDNAEVTLNIPLQGGYEGSELYFQTQSGFDSVNMAVGRSILHAGSHQHGVLPITEGCRYNLIIWMRSSDVRNRICPMCKQPPDLEEVSFGTGDGFKLSTNTQSDNTDTRCIVH